MKRPEGIGESERRFYIRNRNKVKENICINCPYNFACCLESIAYISDSEIRNIARRTGRKPEDFAIIFDDELALELSSGLRRKVKGMLKQPCVFFRAGECLIQDFKPRTCREGICDYSFKNFLGFLEARRLKNQP